MSQRSRQVCHIALPHLSMPHTFNIPRPTGLHATSKSDCDAKNIAYSRTAMQVLAAGMVCNCLMALACHCHCGQSGQDQGERSFMTRVRHVVSTSRMQQQMSHMHADSCMSQPHTASSVCNMLPSIDAHCKLTLKSTWSCFR